MNRKQFDLQMQSNNVTALHKRRKRLDVGDIAATLALALMLVIGASNSAAGFCLRMAIAAPLAWAGATSDATMTRFVMRGYVIRLPAPFGIAS